MANPKISTVYNNAEESRLWATIDNDFSPQSGWRVSAYAEAHKMPHGEGTTLSAYSVPGDHAVLVMGGQQVYPGQTSELVLDGWDVKISNPVAPGVTRMGYIATREVTDPAQTKDIQWWFPMEAWGARQNAVLIILRNAKLGTVAKWQANAPVSFSGGLIFGQTHGPASLTPAPWSIDGGAVEIDGTQFASQQASWSILRVCRGSKPPSVPSGHPPQAWLALSITDANQAKVSLEGHKATKIAVMPYGGTDAKTVHPGGKSAFAHRGGSTNWPEHTMRAYTNAVATAITGLEISVAKTKDGVWIGCHDENLARIGGPSEKVSDITYATIQAAMQDGEYMPVRLDDLLKAYGRSHVIAVDPKYQVGDWEALKTLLTPYKRTIIMKYFGSASWAFAKWKLDGFTTLAYAYDRNKNEAWYTKMLTDPNVDHIMMEFQAPKDTWDRLKASGKTLYSHITNTQQQIDDAAAKGATCTMLANPLLLGTKV